MCPDFEKEDKLLDISSSSRVRVEKNKRIPSSDDGNSVFGTVAQLEQFRIKNNVPEGAEIQYAGCGTHEIEFVWYEYEPDVQLEHDYKMGMTPDD